MSRLLCEGLKRTFKALPDVGLDIETAENGQEAMDILREQEFNLALIDLYLPVLDGIALIRAVRADPSLRDFPLIAMSSGGRGARVPALRAGANGFLAKPVRLNEVVSATLPWLNHNKELQGRNQRRYARYPVSMTGSIQEHNGKTHRGALRQISLGGGFMELPVFLEEGSRVSVFLDDEKTAPVRVEAEVRYRLPSVQSPSGGTGVGLAWCGLEPAARAAVERAHDAAILQCEGIPAP